MQTISKILLLGLLFGCKRTEVNPCFQISIEKVTVLKPNHAKFYDYPDRYLVERKDTLVCGLKKNELQDLLDFLGMPENGIDYCIVRNLAVKEIKNNKK